MSILRKQQLGAYVKGDLSLASFGLNERLGIAATSEDGRFDPFADATHFPLDCRHSRAWKRDFWIAIGSPASRRAPHEIWIRIDIGNRKSGKAPAERL